MEDYLRTVGEEIALDDVSALDPRYSNAGKLHPAIRKLQTSYAKDDPPPTRVKPIPLPLVAHAVRAHHSSNEFMKALMDLIIIAFFFLLRPGEHSYDKKENHPFRLQDVSFQTPTGTTNAATIDEADLALATKVHLQFTTQKNGIKGEHITHGDTTDELQSPLKAVRRRVQHLRANNAPPDTPLHTVFQENGTTRNVRAADITSLLRQSCKTVGKGLGIASKEISARALRAGGAMALLRANVDPVLIRLQGRWKSWTMIRYLHLSATDTSDFATKMISGGTYVISEHATLPTDVPSIIDL